MILGKCPYCKGNVQAIKSTANGKKVNLYTCENAKNAFLRWNKRSFSKYEMKKLLEDEQVIIRLHGRAGTKEYFKYVITDKEYGVSILWDEEVEEKLISS